MSRLSEGRARRFGSLRNPAEIFARLLSNLRKHGIVRVKGRGFRVIRRAAFSYVGLAAGAVAALACAFPVAAGASSLVDRNATHVRLQVNKENVALMSYTSFGHIKRRVVAWGAVNTLLVPNLSLQQVAFKMSYLGASGPIRTEIVKGTFVNSCKPYRGPKLTWFVTGCTAPDGSFWALQSWQRPAPNYGVAPKTKLEGASELRLSHWSGALPVLTVKQDWAFGGRFDHFYGSYTYLGHPQYGFKTTSYGAPLDKFGILIYLDTFNSAYGSGWHRENSYVTHNPSGIWCYSMNPHGSRPTGKGQAYRMTAQSPGALPDVTWAGKSLGPYDAAKDAAANQEQTQSYSDNVCKPN